MIIIFLMKICLEIKILIVMILYFSCINCMHLLPDLEALEEQFSANGETI